jgi:elongation factor G
MPKHPTAKLRNVALLGHGHDGKTSLAEMLLFAAGATERLGKADAGTTTLDFEPEEIKRKITISTALATAPWRDYRITLVDTPGFQDFIGEVNGALRATEGALVVVAATTTLAVGTEKAWEQLDAQQIPRLVVVNKLDKENADFFRTVETLRNGLQPRPVPLQVPIGHEGQFEGVVDLLANKAFRFDAGKAQEIPVPPDLLAMVETYRGQLMEAAAETDDRLLERYLENGTITAEEMAEGIARGVRAGTVAPVLCASALKNIGGAPLLDAIATLLPSPLEARPPVGMNAKTEQEAPLPPDPAGPFVAFVFKTTADPFVGRITFFKAVSGTLRADVPLYNVSRDAAEHAGQIGLPRGKHLEPATEITAGEIGALSKLQATLTGDTLATRDRPFKLAPLALPERAYAAAIAAKVKGDEDKIFAALHKLMTEDPTLELTREPITKQSILHGIGDVHLDVVLEKLKRKYGVEAVLEVPRVPYQETITASARGEKKYKKQSGGAGLYGHCVIEVAPLPRGGGYVWEDKIFGGSIPHNFRPSVEKGVREAMLEGVLTGNPLVDVRVSLLDGSTHAVDGKDIAFKLAGAMALRQAALDARPVLLEPVMHVEVTVPEHQMGDVISELNAKRGRIAGMSAAGDRRQLVEAQVPLAEMYRFPIELRSLTQGRGSYRMSFSHYQEVPHHAAQPLIAAFQKVHQEASERVS